MSIAEYTKIMERIEKLEKRIHDLELLQREQDKVPTIVVRQRGRPPKISEQKAITLNV